MIRVALDLFLLEGPEYVGVMEVLGGECEIVPAREMLMVGPWREIDYSKGPLIADMADQEEMEERRAHERRLLFDDEYAARHRAKMRRAEREDLYQQRVAHRESPDLTFFWLPNVTDNNPDDLDGRHWYPFSGPPPERQQWLVWQEIASANLAYVACPVGWEANPAWPPLPAKIGSGWADTPAEGARKALSTARGIYRRMPYEQYLETPHWQRTREAAVARAGHACEECGAFMVRWRHLEVHHLTYERRGQELPEDLRVLCPDCHAKAHDLPPKEG